jgi:hypothetical protein
MRATLIVFLSSAFLAIGCTQGVGGRCVQDSDCPSGSMCSIHGNPQGGKCQLINGLSTGTGGSPGEGGAGGQGAEGGQGGAEGGHGGSTTDGGRDADAPADARVD